MTATTRPCLVPEEPLPPYAFVPGRFPHPVSDPAGHSFGVAHAPAAPLQPDRFAECRIYLVAVDLFNHGFYWEAHEGWERLWIAAGRAGPTAWFLQGLIKLAAAGVKLREGKPAGARSHAARAGELFLRCRDELAAEAHAGLIFTDLLAFARQAQDGACDPAFLFPFELQPHEENPR